MVVMLLLLNNAYSVVVLSNLSTYLKTVLIKWTFLTSTLLLMKTRVIIEISGWNRGQSSKNKNNKMTHLI